ncbi:MAG: peptidylprolyl isomerase [Candidatus Cloacimonetes bacterium]|nr:peptidylprolyl isomerase [Candidatus Cloacimonadota bacterium]
MRFFLIVLVIVILLPLSAERYAEWQTSMGCFRVELYNTLTPVTVNNFVTLAQANFYDNLIFHRVINGFMIQDGCPLGTGTGGPGYQIDDEFHPDLNHNSAGVLSMANAGPDTGGSQYFITLNPQPHLNGAHAVFGNVIEGIDVVYAIGAVPTDNNDRPITPVTIDSIRIFDFQINGIDPLPGDVDLTAGESITFAVLGSGDDADPIFTWTFDGVNVGATPFYFYTFNTEGEFNLICTVSDGTYSIDIEWHIVVEQTANEDTTIPFVSLFENYPNPFNPQTTIRFSLEQSAPVEMKLYNTRGRYVRTLLSETMSSGIHQVEWQGKDNNGKLVASGVYYCVLKTADNMMVRKVLMMK